MDDEAMFKLDTKLAAAFRSLRKSTKLDKDKAVQLRHYKMRCVVFIHLVLFNTTSAALVQH